MLRKFRKRSVCEVLFVLLAATIGVVGCGEDSTANTAQVEQAATSKARLFPCSAHVEPPIKLPIEPIANSTTYVAELTDGKEFAFTTFDDTGSQRKRLGSSKVNEWKLATRLSADAVVTASVVASQRRLARFPAKTGPFNRLPSKAIFKSCAADTPTSDGKDVVGEVTGWGGGVVTTRRRLCLKMQILEESTGKKSIVTVALGRKCPSSAS